MVHCAAKLTPAAQLVLVFVGTVDEKVLQSSLASASTPSETELYTGSVGKGDFKLSQRPL